MKVRFRDEQSFTRSQILMKIVDNTNASPISIRTDGVNAPSVRKSTFSPEHHDAQHATDLILTHSRRYLADRLIFVSIFICTQEPTDILKRIHDLKPALTAVKGNYQGKGQSIMII